VTASDGVRLRNALSYSPTGTVAGDVPNYVAGWARLGLVMRQKGWRIEVFWNGGGKWYTARCVDRDGRLVVDDFLAGAGATPGGALQALALAAIEGETT
jgi:hypothetical protein